MADAVTDQPAGPVVIDATGFLGMHHPDPSVRAAWKAFFVDRLTTPVLMSLEEVGRCDALVWRASRAVQDAYYPFMDNLHTDADIRRTGYTDVDLDVATTDPTLIGLPAGQRLLLAFTRRHGGQLITADPQLLQHHDLPVGPVPVGRLSVAFPPPLEALYSESLALQIDVLSIEAAAESAAGAGARLPAGSGGGTARNPVVAR